MGILGLFALFDITITQSRVMGFHLNSAIVNLCQYKNLVLYILTYKHINFNSKIKVFLRNFKKI